MGRQVKQAFTFKRGIHVMLGVAQMRQHRQILLRHELLQGHASAGTHVDPHSHHAYKAVALAHRFFGM